MVRSEQPLSVAPVAAGRATTLGQRALDIGLVVLALPFALLLGVVLAAAVLLDSPGPVLYRSRRIGRNGRPFSMYKLRTMRHRDAGPPISAADDPRYTPVGRWLSAKRFDELPQLWNVLRGDMRLVGPRPEIAEFVEDHPDEYRLILGIRPGLTGPAQLEYADEGRMLAGADDRVALYRDRILPLKLAIDLRYIREHSLGGDLRILLRTALLPLTRALVRLRGLAADRPSPPVAVYSAALLVVTVVAFVVLASARA